MRGIKMLLRPAVSQTDTRRIFGETLKGFKDARYHERVSLSQTAWSRNGIRANMLQLLEDRDSIVRFRACFILAVISQDEREAVKPFVPKLTELLRDRSYNSQGIRSQALFALLNVARKDTAVIETVIRGYAHKLTDQNECHVKWYWP